MNTKGQPSACGKLRYMDRAEAHERRAYRCTRCAGFHLTHRAGFKPAQRKAEQQ